MAVAFTFPQRYRLCIVNTTAGEDMNEAWNFITSNFLNN